MSNKPWFLRSKRLGDYSHLRWNDFNELRSVVSEAVAAEYAYSSWRKIKDAALTALEELARKHHCGFRRDAEGGHICIYKRREPVFALRIGNYSRHRVEDLLEGGALYRGIIDIVPSSPINDPSRDEKVRAEIRAFDEPMNVFYFLLPTRDAGKWKSQEALDMVDVIECVKAHPGFSRSDIQHTLNFSPRKTIRLLDLLHRRRILHRRGHYKSSGWYLNCN
jgi:hypothetical protein